jgi:hypothetical protein
MHTNSTIKINNSFILSWKKKNLCPYIYIYIYIYIYPTLILANLAISPAMKSFLSSTYKKKRNGTKKLKKKNKQSEHAYQDIKTK